MRLRRGKTVRAALVAIFVMVLLIDGLTLIRSASANVLWGHWEIGPQVSTETPTATATPTTTGKFVFVTSSGFFGNFGGTAAGDMACNTAATSANLPGTYKAWLSTSTTSPSSTFTQSTVPYTLFDGTQVAANWTALVSGTLDHAIDENEHGSVVSSVLSPWTGTNANGTANSLTCGNWTSTGALGVAGSVSSTNFAWTASTGTNCDNFFPLYCFQQ